MNLRHRMYPTLLLAAAIVAVSVSCGDDTKSPTTPRLTPGQINAEISDGAHGNGNADVYYLLPMAIPDKAPSFKARPFQPNLPVTFKIRNLATGAVINSGDPGLSAVQMSAQLEDYHAVWNTKSPVDVPAGTYRVETWIGSQRVAFADVVLFTTLKQFFSIDLKQFVPLPDDWSLLIRVRVQQGWNCQNKATCTTQIVTNTPPPGQTYTIVQTPGGANAGFFPAGWFDTKGGTINQVLVTIEDVTSQLSTANGGTGCGVGKTVMLTDEHCVRFTVDPQVTISTQPGQPAIVATCIDGITGPHKQVLKYDVNEVPEFLQNVAPPAPFVCHEGIGFNGPSSSNRFVNLAERIGSALKGLVTPKNAYAIDLGVGGALDAGGSCCSLLAFGTAMTMTNVSPLTQRASANGSVPEQIQIMTVHDGAVGVAGQTVTCQVLSGGGTVGTPAVTDQSGITTCPWVLGPSAGPNTLLVTANGIDDCGLFTEECGGIVAVQGDPKTGLPVRVTLNRSLVFTAQAIAPSSIISCSSDASGGDLLDRGFYVPSYPGVSLNQATLNFSSDTPGDYTISLTARKGTFDGPIVGVASATVTLANGRGSFAPATFVFPTPNPSIDAGTPVTFALAQTAGPSSEGGVFYEVPSNGNANCPVQQTNGTTPPLDTPRRVGVNIVIQGVPIVIP